jgi:integration host factor subunit beta
MDASPVRLIFVQARSGSLFFTTSWGGHMVRSELIEILSTKADVNKSVAEEIVRVFFDEILSALTTEGRVEVRGFGSFSVRKYRSYEGRNPKSGDVIVVQEKKLPFFKTGLELRQRVDGLGVSENIPRR